MNRHAECPDLAALERLARSDGAESEVSIHVKICETCSQRVQQIRADNDLLSEFAAANADQFGRRPAAPLPEIDGYDVLREIHRGAQGIVYEAVQITAHRHVAIKILLPGTLRDDRTRARLEREVDAIARLRHPNIVTLYERGTSEDGRDFLAMELIDGLPLNEFALSMRETAGEPAAIRRLLRVYVKICQAVSAAHQRGVIHRDLKPANILVDAADEPHVLDFGIARPVAAEAPDALQTVAGEFLGTFAYAAPEQIRGDPRDIDVRSDVYALGVILYLLLTGQRPFAIAGSIADVVKTILEQPAAAPSRINSQADSELDAIVLKALRKDPQGRYQSADALAEDVQHYLAGEPVNAKRGSRWYLARKMIQRHKIPLSAAAALFVAAIITAVAMFALKRQADDATQSATSTLKLILGLFESDRFWIKPDSTTLPNLLQEAEGIAQKELAGHPAILADVHTRLGEARLDREAWRLALEQFERALRLRRQVYAESHPAIAESLHSCARAHWYLGEYDQAEQLYQAALDIRKANLGRVNEDVAQTTTHLAATYRQQGRYDLAESLNREALAIRRELYDSNDPLIAASLNNLGVFLRDDRRCEEAIPLFNEALQIISAKDGAVTMRREAFTLKNLAECLLMIGDLDAAEQAAQRSLALKRELFEHNTSIAETEVVLGQIRFERGDLEQARTHGTTALEAQEEAGRELHKDLAAPLVLLARIHLAHSEFDQAIEKLQRALTIRTAVLPARHWEIEEARELLAQAQQSIQPTSD